LGSKNFSTLTHPSDRIQTMRVFAASDMHVGHTNIMKYELGRAFDDVPHMNEMLIRWWNETVAPEDVVFFVGDFAMGQIADTLPLALRLNGTKVMVYGNHDRPFGVEPQDPKNMSDPREKRWKSKVKYAKWFQEYINAGFVIVTREIEMTFQGVPIRITHFPYEGDHDEENVRYAHLYPEDDGTLLVHGHVHSLWKTKTSSKGTPMVNVGLDVWGYRPVLLEDAINEAMPF
jgi:calcineurin-like phosphoesterase family protein